MSTSLLGEIFQQVLILINSLKWMSHIFARTPCSHLCEKIFYRALFLPHFFANDSKLFCPRTVVSF